MTWLQQGNIQIKIDLLDKGKLLYGFQFRLLRS